MGGRGRWWLCARWPRKVCAHLLVSRSLACCLVSWPMGWIGHLACRNSCSFRSALLGLSVVTQTPAHSDHYDTYRSKAWVQHSPTLVMCPMPCLLWVSRDCVHLLHSGSKEGK